MNERLKYETIKELTDHHGNKRRAALKLNHRHPSGQSFDQCVQSKRKKPALFMGTETGALLIPSTGGYSAKKIIAFV